jgi:Fe-S oxidoreductase
MSGRPGQRPMRALPLLEEHRPKLETCVYCPKLCRSACPVSNAEPRETLIPWGKMTTAYMAALGDVPLEPAFARPAWACTGCGACSKACDHDNDVAGTLLVARSAFVATGVAPPAATRAIATFEAREREARQAAEALAGTAVSRTALLPGCTYLRRSPDVARDALRVATALLGPVQVLGDCCGLPLLMAGDGPGFEQHARRFASKVERFDHLVVVDPGCALVLRGPRVSLLVEEAARRVGAFSQTPQARSVRYHDPCKLGRGLGLYGEPRAVLTRILGRAPEELMDRREQATCSGAGGLLPLTMPDVSRRIADKRLDDHQEAGGGEIVTACASSLLALRKAAKGKVAVTDLTSWMARALP